MSTALRVLRHYTAPRLREVLLVRDRARERHID